MRFFSVGGNFCASARKACRCFFSRRRELFSCFAWKDSFAKEEKTGLEHSMGISAISCFSIKARTTGAVSTEKGMYFISLKLSSFKAVIWCSKTSERYFKSWVFFSVFSFKSTRSEIKNWLLDLAALSKSLSALLLSMRV